MHEESNNKIESMQDQWWLAKNGVAEGPLSQQELCDALKANHVSSADYVYSAGERAWKPLSDSNEFQSGIEDSALKVPPVPPVESYQIEPLFTNDRLPPMANWICIYALLISPWLWCLYTVSLMKSGTFLAENAPLMGVEILVIFISMLVSMAMTVSLFIGGMRLKAMRRSGPTIIILSIVVATAAHTLLFFWLMVLLTMSDPSGFASETVAVELIDYFVGIVGLCEAVFMVTALLWLRRNERFLPLS